jgi:hypothetical protein
MDIYRIVFYLLGAILLFIGIVYMARFYVKWKTKRSLAILIISVIFLIGGILGYFYPGLPIPGMGATVKKNIIIVLIISFWIFLFYPEIKRVISRRKTKLVTDPESNTPGYKLFEGKKNGFRISFEYPDSWGRVSLATSGNYNYMPLLPPDSSVIIDSVTNKNKGGDYIDASDLIQSKLDSKSRQTYLKILSRNKIQVGQGEGEEVTFSYIFPGQDPQKPPVYARAGEVVIFRLLDVNYKDHIYDINVVAAEDKYESAKVDFEHLIRTFRFLD